MTLKVYVLLVGLVASAAETPVALYKGLGPWHHPIDTNNAEAAKYFDQGLTLAFSFNRYEALRSFRKAAELDPAAAMPYWGMALAQGPYINMDGDPSYDLKGACSAVDSGLKVKGVSPRESAYLQAAKTWCPEFHPDAYIDAMRKLTDQYPDDLDALTIYAESLLIPVRWHWYAADGTPAPGVAKAERALESVIRRSPQHPGANHYLIHAVESSQSPERAVASAQRLMGIVPAAGHMVHMPGHIWLLLGDWETAAVVNERAATVDREYFAAAKTMGGSYTPYYLHNLHFIVYAREMQGRKADGLRSANELASAMQPMAETMPEMVDSFFGIPLLAQVRFGEWDRILKAPEPEGKMAISRAIRRYARTLALLARGDARQATVETEAFQRERGNVDSDAAWGQNKAKDVLAMASEILAAKLAGTEPQAEPHWARAVAAQDRFVYDEPPAWYYPVRESQGAYLLRSGKALEAEAVFREGVNRSPRNGRMLFGLLKSLRAQGKQADAEWVEREFKASWSRADVTLALNDF